MLSHFAPESGIWWELLFVLGAGATVIVALAAMAGRWIRDAVWQRTLWQAATLSLFALVLFELTGIGPGLVQLARETLQPMNSTAAARGSAVAAVQPARAVDFALGATTMVPGLSSSAEQAIVDKQLMAPARRTLLGKPAVAPAGRTLLDKPAVAPVGIPGTMVVAPAAQAGADTGLCSPAATALPGGTWWPALIWALGIVTVAVRMAWSRVLLLMFRRRCQPVSDAAMGGRVNVLARRLGIRRRVRLLTARSLSSPVVFGSFRPVILVPAGFDDEFDPSQQEAMLAHELAHLAASDPFWQSASLWLCAALWWQPLAWWSRRRLRAASEAAADEASLLVPDGPCVLAESLVALGRRLVRPRSLGWLSIEGGGFRSGLGQRVERLLNLRRPWRAPGRARLAFAHTTLPVVFVLTAVLGTAWVPSQVPFNEGGATMNVLVTSWRHSLTAAVLAAFLAPATVTAEEGDRPKDAPAPAVQGQPDRPEREAKMREFMEKRKALEEKASEIRRKMQALKPGQEAEAKELQGQMKAIGEQMKAMHEQMRPMGMRPGGPGPGREGMSPRLEELKEAYRKAKEAGKEDEAERIKHEAEQIMQNMRERGPRGGPEGGPRPESPGDLEARIHHLRAAAENLRAAGCIREAEHVMQLIEHPQGRPGAERPNREGGPRPEGRRGPEGAGRGPDAGNMQGLRSEVQQMRREMQELREQLKRMTEQKGERK